MAEAPKLFGMLDRQPLKQEGIDWAGDCAICPNSEGMHNRRTRESRPVADHPAAIPRVVKKIEFVSSL